MWPHCACTGYYPENLLELSFKIDSWREPQVEERNDTLEPVQQYFLSDTNTCGVLLTAPNPYPRTITVQRETSEDRRRNCCSMITAVPGVVDSLLVRTISVSPRPAADPIAGKVSSHSPLLTGSPLSSSSGAPADGDKHEGMPTETSLSKSCVAESDMQPRFPVLAAALDRSEAHPEQLPTLFAAPKHT